MANSVKIIFHIDFNAYFCSVAELYNPLLRNTAFAIGNPNSNYGVLSTASYKAREYGIKAGMPQIEALRILPTLNIVSIPYERYQYYHYRFIDLISEYTNLIKVGSIDEVYADMTEICKKRNVIVVAKEIQTRLLEEYHLSCSIGIAPTLFLAKMASDLKKPLGITILRKRDVKNIIYPLSVKEIYGIGKKTYPLLINKSILTIADFMDDKNKEIVSNIISSKYYLEIRDKILGNSSDIILEKKDKDQDSISLVRTYDNRLSIEEEILGEFKILTKQLYKKLISLNVKTNNVAITLRDISFKTIIRSKSIPYTDNFNDILNVVYDLAQENLDNKVYRLIGISFNNLNNDIKKSEYNLFTINENKKLKVKETIDELNKKYNNVIINYKDSK